MRNVLEYLEAAYLKAPEKTAYASETDSLTFRNYDIDRLKNLIETLS